jgi:hypothetical protein
MVGSPETFINKISSLPIWPKPRLMLYEYENALTL